MNNVVPVQQAPKKSVLVDMANRYGMEPGVFAETLKATVVPRDTSNEQFAAFLLVAKEYDLNPITKEIYAFPTRGGGIQPIVSIDGWTNLINSHPAMDGMEFADALNDKGEVVAVTCRLYRKDRSRPIEATEYMIECRRNTDTWRQWPRRMLRHKALIQAARYAFGLAGIIDPDEWERSPERGETAAVVSPPSPPAPPPAPASDLKAELVASVKFEDAKGEPGDMTEVYETFELALVEAVDADDVERITSEHGVDVDDHVIALMRAKRLKEVNGERRK